MMSWEFGFEAWKIIYGTCRFHFVDYYAGQVPTAAPAAMAVALDGARCLGRVVLVEGERGLGGVVEVVDCIGGVNLVRDFF